MYYQGRKQKMTDSRVVYTMTKVGVHMGYNIIELTTKYRQYSRPDQKYFKNLYESESTCYTFCKDGLDYNKHGNLCQCCQTSVEDAIQQLDRFLNGVYYIFTYDEYFKEVSKHTSSHGFGYSINMLKSFCKRHKNGDLRDKAIVEERLTDVNYHTLCGFFADGDYDGAMQNIIEDHTPTYSYMVKVRKKGCEIPDREEFDYIIHQAIEKYFKDNPNKFKDYEVVDVKASE